MAADFGKIIEAMGAKVVSIDKKDASEKLRNFRMQRVGTNLAPEEKTAVAS